MMRFIAPQRLYLLAVLLLPAATFVYAAWRRKRELRRLFADPGAAEKATRLSRGGRVVIIIRLRVRTRSFFFPLPQIVSSSLAE